MNKDLSEIIKKYIYYHLSHRNDIVIKVDQNGKRYDVKIFINLKPTDGLYSRINKGIDTVKLKKEINEFFTLDELYVYYRIME